MRVRICLWLGVLAVGFMATGRAEDGAVYVNGRYSGYQSTSGALYLNNRNAGFTSSSGAVYLDNRYAGYTRGDRFTSATSTRAGSVGNSFR